MSKKKLYVYILAAKRNGKLHIGVAEDLHARTAQHKMGKVKDSTRKSSVIRLVYFETAPDMLSAITREAELKEWRSVRIRQLIEKMNPKWVDLYDQIV